MICMQKCWQTDISNQPIAVYGIIAVQCWIQLEYFVAFNANNMGQNSIGLSSQFFLLFWEHGPWRLNLEFRGVFLKIGNF